MDETIVTRLSDIAQQSYEDGCHKQHLGIDAYIDEAKAFLATQSVDETQWEGLIRLGASNSIYGQLSDEAVIASFFLSWRMK